MPAAEKYRSKTLAAWLALLGGTLGLHRWYLHGPRDIWGWLYPLPTLLGLAGVLRMRNLGQDDRTAWLLIPLLGLAISAAMLSAIVYALTPDDKWNARHNSGQPGAPAGWGAVLAAIAALLVGGTVLMGTIAFSGQKFFEWELEDSAQPAGKLSSLMKEKPAASHAAAAMVKVKWPLQLAGACYRTLDKAMPQLPLAAPSLGFVDRFMTT